MVVVGLRELRLERFLSDLISLPNLKFEKHVCKRFSRDVSSLHQRCISISFSLVDVICSLSLAAFSCTCGVFDLLEDFSVVWIDYLCGHFERFICRTAA